MMHWCLLCRTVGEWHFELLWLQICWTAWQITWISENTSQICFVFGTYTGRTAAANLIMSICQSVRLHGWDFSKIYRLLPVSVKLRQKSQTLWSSMNWYLKTETCCVLCEVRNNWWFIRLAIYETNTGNRISRPLRDKYMKLHIHCSYEPSWHLYPVSKVHRCRPTS